jgi:hypothetical protein
MSEAPESTTSAEGASLPAGVIHRTNRVWARLADWLAGRYGAVLVLILLDYVALSLLSGETAVWARVAAELSLGLTLFATLIAARAHQRVVFLAALVIFAGVFALCGATLMQSEFAASVVYLMGALLIVVTPILILRDIASHKVVTTDSVMGAACAYLLFGICFALIYATVGQFTPHGFFGAGKSPTSDFLFFSFTTLTTVGYGNLIPANPVGQSLSMVEALSGQIYLVVVVARLVALWGQERPNVMWLRHRRDTDRRDTERHAD